jgi:hypothetical protein
MDGKWSERCGSELQGGGESLALWQIQTTSGAKDEPLGIPRLDVWAEALFVL